MLENEELCRIFGPKEEEVTGLWRKLHNEEFNLKLFRGLNHRDEDRTCSMHGGDEKFRMLVNKSGRKMQLGGQRRR